MKYKNLEDMLRNPDHVKVEDVAQYAIFERDLNDSDKFTAICDLIVACEQSQVRVHQSRENKELASLRKFYELTINDKVDPLDAAVHIGWLDN